MQPQTSPLFPPAPADWRGIPPKVFFSYLTVRLLCLVALIGTFYLLNCLVLDGGNRHPKQGSYQAWSILFFRVGLVVALALSARDTWGGTTTRDFVCGAAGAAVGLVVPMIFFGGWKIFLIPPFPIFIIGGAGFLCFMDRANQQQRISRLREMTVYEARKPAGPERRGRQ